jgi:hypothetical protein
MAQYTRRPFGFTISSAQALRRTDPDRGDPPGTGWTIVVGVGIGIGIAVAIASDFVFDILLRR